jgi:hypothetical protein
MFDLPVKRTTLGNGLTTRVFGQTIGEAIAGGIARANEPITVTAIEPLPPYEYEPTPLAELVAELPLLPQIADAPRRAAASTPEQVELTGLPARAPPPAEGVAPRPTLRLVPPSEPSQPSGVRDAIQRAAAIAGAAEVALGAGVILWSAEQRERAAREYGEEVARTAERFGLNLSTSEGVSAARTFVNSRENWSNIETGSLRFQDPRRAGEAQFVVIMDAELDNPGIYNRAVQGQRESLGILQGAINAVNESWARDQIATIRQRQPERLAEILPELYERRDPSERPIPAAADQRDRSRFSPFVRFNPTARDAQINATGIFPGSRDGRVWFTRFRDVAGITRASDLETKLYMQELWPRTSRAHGANPSQFESGATLRLVTNVPDAVRARGPTNYVNGIRQWYVSRPIPAPDVRFVIKRMPGSP